MSWINKDTEIYCSFAETAGNTGCQMMNSAFYYYGLNKVYKSFSVDNIEKAVDAVRALDIRGFAITMPYKKEILQYVDSIEKNTEKIGAANTVINDDGKLVAYNTDYLSAKSFLESASGKREYSGFYILGSGGYASAVKQAAEDIGREYTNINRDEWDKIYTINDSLVFNCTPVSGISSKISATNEFIDCIVTTTTGRKLALTQASHQFKMYTGLEFPFQY
tara:strand:- start:3323 stop:3985 length:663 start_codon:yes stop_codon:yes gene_type:complete